ncbi:unnamed protein product [Merluccius merluccius]
MSPGVPPRSLLALIAALAVRWSNSEHTTCQIWSSAGKVVQKGSSLRMFCTFESMCQRAVYVEGVRHDHTSLNSTTVYIEVINITGHLTCLCQCADRPTAGEECGIDVLAGCKVMSASGNYTGGSVNRTGFSVGSTLARVKLNLKPSIQTMSVKVYVRNDLGSAESDTYKFTLRDIVKPSPPALILVECSSRSCNITWDRPLETHLEIQYRFQPDSADPTLLSTGYLVEWYPQGQQFEKLQWMQLSTAESHALITDMESYECYDGAVYVFYKSSVGKASFEGVNTLVTVPQGAPSVTPHLGGDTVTLTWTQVPRVKRGGCVRNYTIYIKNNKDSKDKRIYQFPASVHQCTTDRLPPATYIVWMTAWTAEGEGPGSEKVEIVIQQEEEEEEEEEQHIVKFFEYPNVNGEELRHHHEGITHVSSLHRPERDSGTAHQTLYIKSVSHDSDSSHYTQGSLDTGTTVAGYLSSPAEESGAEDAERDEEEECTDFSPCNIFDEPLVFAGMLTLDTVKIDCRNLWENGL